VNLIEQTSVLLMARSGSKRLINKNLAEFGPNQNKVTLLEWKINQLTEIFPSQNIIFSSDSSEYLDIGARFNLTLHKRSSELTDFGSFAENLRTVAAEAKTDYVMYSNGPCNPLIGPNRMRHFLNSIDEKKLDDGVCAVEELKGHIGFNTNWLNFEPGENHLGSELLENPFRVVWGLSIRSREKVKAHGSMFTKFYPSYKVPSWESIDIDYPEDLIIAHSFLDKYSNQESNSAIFDFPIV
jgi:CMP-N-acetylneuraminic acid synthetase